MYGEKILRALYKRAGIILVSFLALIVLYFSNHNGRLSITVSPVGTGKNISYKISRQGTADYQEINSKSSSVSKLITKANYEVVVSNGETSYHAVVKVHGFFATTTVSAKLLPEKSREYIGFSPSACEFVSGGVLYSYVCSNSTINITSHLPANASTPTYNVKSDTPMGFIRGNVLTKDGAIILGQAIPVEGGDVQPYVAYTLGGDGLNPKTTTVLPDVDKFSVYSFAAYKDGFIAYDTTYSKILYYASVDAKPQTISLARPKSDKLLPIKLTTSGDSIVVVYSDFQGAVGESEDKPGKIAGVKATVSIYSGGQTKQFVIDKQIDTARTCGTNKLCILSQQTPESLNVYDIGGAKASLLYGVSGVHEMLTSGTTLVAVRDKEILGIDVDKRTGYSQYTMGDFTACGLPTQNDGNAYLLCLTDKEGKNIVLRIDPSKDNNGSIDKKLASLVGFASIDSVSPYKNQIFISLRLNDNFYDPVTRSFGYDPADKKTTQDLVNKKLDSIGIDRKAYDIVLIPN